MNEIASASRGYALRVLAANMSSRYHELDRLERYARGTQYDGRPNFLNDAYPLLDRAPLIVCPVVDEATRSHVDMVLGDGRFPKITSRPGEDDSAFDEQFGLSEVDSATLDRFIAAIDKQARLRSALRGMLYSAMTERTAVAIACVRAGKLSVERTKAKWCTPTFDERQPERVTRLEIRYPYLEEFKDARTGVAGMRCLLYRRVVDDHADTTFVPAVASNTGAEPDEWIADTRKTVEHGLGFCPVLWYRFEPPCEDVSRIDGRAIHDDLLDEIDALNLAVSMRHRAAIYCGDPQPVETGVDHDYNPAPMGQQARSILLSTGRDHPENDKWIIGGDGPSGMPARKKGPGVWLRYEKPDSKVSYLSLDPGALKPIEEDADDIMAMIAEALAWVPTDPKQMQLGSALSGRAIEWLHKKQVDRDNTIRDEFGEHAILALVDLLLRVALRMDARRLRLPGIVEAQRVLRRFEAMIDAADGGGSEWIAPQLSLRWGPYFALTETDQKMLGDNVRADYEVGIITRRTAVEKVAAYYSIGDVDQYIKALDDDDDKRANGLRGAVEALKIQAGDKQEPDEDDAMRSVGEPPQKLINGAAAMVADA